MFPKIVRKKNQIIHQLIGFSILFTIHFGVALFLETPIINFGEKTLTAEIFGSPRSLSPATRIFNPIPRLRGFLNILEVNMFK